MGRKGNHLVLDGRPYRSIGFDAPQMATWWAVNRGCGTQVDDPELDRFFASLAPSTLVGFWATQAMALNKTTHALDWTGIDRVFRAAERHHQLLVPVLSTQSGNCSDGHWKDKAWYDGGYRQAFDDDGRHLEPLSYWDYLQAVVPRYAKSPALGMWEPVSEPEASNCEAGRRGNDCTGHVVCPPGASSALRGFFDDVGGELKQLDDRHLVTSGTVGGGQCGTAGADYAFVHASASLDICERHDYDPPSPPLSALSQATMEACRQAGKAFVVGEAGISGAERTDGCLGLAQRRDAMRARSDAYLAGGAQALLVWQWVAESPGSCDYPVGPGDPMLADVVAGAGRRS